MFLSCAKTQIRYENLTDRFATYSFSILTCMSWFDAKMFGCFERRSSRKSVMMRAAFLYRSVLFPIRSWSSLNCAWISAFSCFAYVSLSSICSILSSRNWTKLSSFFDGFVAVWKTGFPANDEWRLSVERTLIELPLRPLRWLCRTGVVP